MTFDLRVVELPLHYPALKYFNISSMKLSLYSLTVEHEVEGHEPDETQAPYRPKLDS